MAEDPRRIVHRRADQHCERCGRVIREQEFASIHHRRRRSQGGQNTPENMTLLHGSGVTGCHGWVHAHPADAMKEGFLVPAWLDPADVPVKMPQGMALLGATYTWLESPPAPAMTVQEILQSRGLIP